MVERTRSSIRVQSWVLLLTLAMTPSCRHDRAVLRSGDLVFQDLDGCALCDSIESVTKEQFDVAGPDLSHVAIVSVEDDGVFVYEAWDQVRKLPWREFLAKADYEVAHQVVKRPVGIEDAVWTKVQARLDQLVGRPYDEAFLVDNGAYYCSELVVEAFNAAFEEDYFSYVPMHYGEPGSPALLAWTAYFDSKGLRVPHGEPGASPLGLFLSEKLVEVQD